MATVDTLVARARKMLRGSKREPFRLLADDVAAVDEFLPITVAPPVNTAVDDYVCVGTELMLVTSVDLSTDPPRLNVIRGVDGTVVPATHPAGSRVELNWRWFTSDLLHWLADDIRSWPEGIFTPTTSAVLSLGASSRSVDLPLTRFQWPLALLQKVSTKEWTPVPAGKFRIHQGLPTSEFASGNALIMPPNPFSSQLILTYASGFDLSAVETVTTDLATIGVTERLYDAALHGVAFRALAGDEASRLDDHSQPEPRSAEEVEAFDQMRAASAYKAIRDLRLEEEKRRLRTLYPVKVG